MAKWNIDLGHSAINFQVKHMMVSKVKVYLTVTQQILRQQILQI